MVIESSETTRKTTNGRHDVVTHRIIVSGLVLTVVLCVCAITFLESENKPPDITLANMATMSLGALAMSVVSVMRPRDDGNEKHRPG